MCYLFLLQALHAKLVQEQESWTQELKAKQESLSKRNIILDAKEEEINNDLERLTEERRVALEDIKRLAEMETRAWGAERELQTKHDEHLKEVSCCGILSSTCICIAFQQEGCRQCLQNLTSWQKGSANWT